MNNFTLAKDQLKAKGYYLPLYPTKDFITAVIQKHKRLLKVDMIRPISESLIDLPFINGEILHDAIRSDYPFSRLVPDNYSHGLRHYIFNLMNTFTGGEFE